ncbi:MAG: GNAT family N-acetyltransferase [Anaerolineales bacterium]
MIPPAPENPLEILRTRRLILTRLQNAHVPALVALWADPEVTRFMGGPRERGFLVSDLEKTALAPFAEKYDLWALVEIDSGMVIGHCGLMEKEVEGTSDIELIYVLAAAAWGKGYATEIAAALKEYAFHILGLKRLISLIEPGNRRSERVAVKSGMRLERETVRPGGFVRLLYSINA